MPCFPCCATYTKWAVIGNLRISKILRGHRQSETMYNLNETLAGFLFCTWINMKQSGIKHVKDMA